MRLAILAFICSFSVCAQTAFLIKPNELQVNCSKNSANVIMDKLRLHTKSNIRTVSAYVANEGMCLALADYFRNQSALKVTLETRLNQKKAEARELPCDGNNCYTVYRNYLAEYVSVLVNGVQFTGQGIVPGSERIETVEWDSRYCPPSHPDCDL